MYVIIPLRVNSLKKPLQQQLLAKKFQKKIPSRLKRNITVAFESCKTSPTIHVWCLHIPYHSWIGKYTVRPMDPSWVCSTTSGFAIITWNKEKPWKSPRVSCKQPWQSLGLIACKSIHGFSGNGGGCVSHRTLRNFWPGDNLSNWLSLSFTFNHTPGISGDHLKTWILPLCAICMHCTHLFII